MSVRAETYIIYGRKLDVKKAFSNEVYDQLEPLEFPWRGENAKGTFGILLGGMSTDYAIAGYCIDVANNTDFEGFELTNLDELVIPELETIDWFGENNLEQFVENPHNCLSTFIVTHYH